MAASRFSQVNACCFWFSALLTLALFLACGQRIDWYMDADFCYYDYYCCSLACLGRCRRRMCSGGEHYYIRPLGQDKLPPPKLVTDGNITANEFTDAGDDEVDYWSLPVAMAVGGLGSILLIVATCGPLARRGSGPACTACIILTAFIMHLVAVICLGVQFFTSYNNQWVYNHFRDPSYLQIDGTLADYFTGDRYYYQFGNTIYSVFIFGIFLLPFEIVYMCLIVSMSQEKQWVHGVEELSLRSTRIDSVARA